MRDILPHTLTVEADDVISHRRCAKCDIDTGMKADGTYTPYTLHPFTEVIAGRQQDQIAVFCVTCFDELENARARDRVAMMSRPPLRAVAG